MKRWIVFCLTLLISFTLVACNSGADENTTVLRGERNGIILEITYKADGDKVIEQTANNEIPYEALGVTTEEEAKEILAETVAAYGSVDGVVHNVTYKDDKVLESLTVDFTKADLEEVSQLSGSTYEGDVSQGVSLEKSVELLEQQGFEVVE